MWDSGPESEDEKDEELESSKKEEKQTRKKKKVPSEKRVQPERSVKSTKTPVTHQYRKNQVKKGRKISSSKGESEDEGYDVRSSPKKMEKEKEKEEPYGKVGLKYIVDEEQVKKQSDREFAQKKLHERAQKLKQTFAKVFPEDEWEYKSDKKNGITTYTNKSGQTITVQEEKEDLKFSGAPLKKLVEATQEYEKDFKMEGMTYEVEAETLEDAKGFMKELYLNGFDLNKITAIQSENNEKFDLEAVKKEIVKSMEEKMEKRKGKSPKPHKGSEED